MLSDKSKLNWYIVPRKNAFYLNVKVRPAPFKYIFFKQNTIIKKLHQTDIYILQNYQ